MAIPKKNKKENRVFNFSVEGSTEKWYLDWLKKKINTYEGVKYKVEINSKVEKDPTQRVKGMTIVDKVVIIHLYDYEGNAPNQIQQFRSTMDKMKEAEKMGKKVTYQMGYSNLSFDLWMILHKTTCNASYIQPGNYLTPINNAFGEKFQSMDEYKKEKNFKQLLESLTLQDVKDAIQRAEAIQRINVHQGNKQNYRNFEYYSNNPSLSIHEHVKKILQECGVI